MSLPADLGTLDENGFRVSLQGATLPDFVQMECLAQSNRVFRITSGHRIGYLFFAKGQMIHALSGDHIGEAAALEILKWKDGSVEPCNVGWPDTPTIQSTWQNLLLLAAQARDESGRHKLVSFPKNRAQPQSREMPSSSPPSSQSLALAQFQAFVRLDPQGNIVSAKGESEELAPIAAYTARLAELIGNMLGMEGFTSLECSFPSERVFLHRERSGNLVALKMPLDAEAGALRERFGM